MRIRTAMSAALVTLAIAGFASAASAQGLTRAEVRQQLVEAAANGSPFVSDTSYPDVSPVFAQRFAHVNAQNPDYGPAMSGSSVSGGGTASVNHRDVADNCVGPASFCAIYRGS